MQPCPSLQGSQSEFKEKEFIKRKPPVIYARPSVKRIQVYTSFGKMQLQYAFGQRRQIILPDYGRRHKIGKSGGMFSHNAEQDLPELFLADPPRNPVYRHHPLCMDERVSVIGDKLKLR